MRSLLCLLLLVMAACRTARAEKPPPRHGSVSATLLADPNAPQIELAERQDFRAAWLDPENPMPEYPAALIPLGLPAHSVAVRLLLSEEGRVSQLGPSPLRPSTEGPYRAEFEQAVQNAVAAWTGGPPRVRQFVAGPDADADGKPDFDRLKREQVLKAYFDVVFVFELRGGKPSVRTATP